MRLLGDILPEGQLIVAVVQCGEEFHAKCQSGCTVLPVGLIKLAHEPPLEKLSPTVATPRAQA
jgi:hypothetical protein